MSLTATMYRQVLKAVQKVDRHYKENPTHTMRAILGQSWNPKYCWDKTCLKQQLTPSPPRAPTASRGKPAASVSTTVRNVMETPSLKITSKFFRMCLRQFALEQKAASSSSSKATGGSSTRVNSNMTTEMQKVFWLLKQCQAAVPESEKEKKSSEVDATTAEAMGSFIDRATKVEFLGDETTTFSVRTVIPTMKNHNPLPRHSVPEDPVWMLQTSWSYPSPLCTELLLLEACHARLSAEKADTSLVSKKVKGGSGGGFTSDIVSLLSKEQLTKDKMRDYFLKLPAQTTTITPDGLLEIVCRTEHVGTVRRVKSQTKADENEEDEDDDEDDDTSNAAAAKSSEGKSIKEEHAFHYFIAIRNVSDTVVNDEAAASLDATENGGKLPKAKAPLAVKPAKGKTLTLLSRHWSFIDAETGDVREVTGAGVVGQFPTLAPGESHTYVSGTTMAGKYGYMKGSFQFAVHKDEDEATDAAATTTTSSKAKGGVKKGIKAVVKKTSKKSSAASSNGEGTVDEMPSNLQLDRTVNAEIGATSLYTTSKATDFEPFGFTTEKK